MTTKKKAKRTKLGLELEGAFKEMAAHSTWRDPVAEL